ncbi:hypothetical protein [Paenibacillus macerans]|uniref:hypothetical protein n=1 Tax=Paenibacillus macerans TaxID=44252 RepID=UPI003D31696C
MRTGTQNGLAGARWMLAAAVIMLAAGSFYFFGYRPAVSESASLQSEREEKEQFLQKTAAVVSAKRDEAAAGNASADAAKREATIPARPDREGILLDLERAAKESGVQLQEIVFEEPEAGLQEGALEGVSTVDSSASDENGFIAGNTATSNPSRSFSGGLSAALHGAGLVEETALGSAGISAVSLQVNLKGTLAAVQSFSASLQEAERLYVVRSFGYGRDEVTGSETSVIGLAAFYRE